MALPTAFEDAEDAWAWLLEQRRLNLDRARLAVGGDSVGGSLAAALANSLGQALVRPCLQVLLYPVTDASCWRESHQRYASGYLLERQSLEWFYSHYQRRPEDRADPRLSPLLGRCRRAWHPPGCCWPATTRCWTRAWPMPRTCVSRARRCSFRSTRA